MFKIFIAGDVMIGRLVDQIFPEHVEDLEDHYHASHLIRVRNPKAIEQIRALGHKYIWGNVINDILSCDLRIINLETSVTTNAEKWPEKVFNYRSHPENIKTLHVSQIDYCSLANNHTLDYGVKGMLETMKTLKDWNIAFAGVGESWSEAFRPTYLVRSGVKFAFYSISDHPRMWAAKSDSPGINFLDIDHYKESDMERIKNILKDEKEKENPDVIIFSLHWGSNYQWEPSRKFKMFARELIDSGIDIIHGHSSHHIQGIEIYKGKPIIYGCGDFIDDYAIDEDFRNDLGFAYYLHLNPINNRCVRIELSPTKISLFQVNKVQQGEPDYQWLYLTMKQLCSQMGTELTILENGNLGVNMIEPV